LYQESIDVAPANNNSMWLQKAAHYYRYCQANFKTLPIVWMDMWKRGKHLLGYITKGERSRSLRLGVWKKRKPCFDALIARCWKNRKSAQDFARVAILSFPDEFERLDAFARIYGFDL
jgi:hypothetical protein